MNIFTKLKYTFIKIYFPYLVSILWTIVLLYLSLGRMPDNEKIKFTIPHLDKFVHFTMYFIYTSVLLIERKTKTRQTLSLIIIYTIAFGIFMEVLQSQIFTYRSGDYLDVVFNSLGVLIAVLVKKKVISFIKP